LNQGIVNGAWVKPGFVPVMAAGIGVYRVFRQLLFAAQKSSSLSIKKETR